MSEVVFTQDISSGTVHKRYRMPGGQLASFEGCNLDDAGDYEVLVDETQPKRSGTRCLNCFPLTNAPSVTVNPEDDGSTHDELVP
jgi:hypothetical protein